MAITTLLTNVFVCLFCMLPICLYIKISIAQLDLHYDFKFVYIANYWEYSQQAPLCEVYSESVLACLFGFSWPLLLSHLRVNHACQCYVAATQLKNFTYNYVSDCLLVLVHNCLPLNAIIVILAHPTMSCIHLVHCYKFPLYQLQPEPKTDNENGQHAGIAGSPERWKVIHFSHYDYLHSFDIQ